MQQKTRRSRTFGFALLLAFSMLTSPALQSTAQANPKSTQRLTVTFNADSSVLDSRAKKSLKSFYRDHKNDKSLSVTGYVQRSDISSNNRSLSLRRAKAVRSYFKSLGFKGAITVHAGKVPSHNPWAASSRKAIVKVVANDQNSQLSTAGLSVTINADVLTVSYAELQASFTWPKGGYWHQAIDSRSATVSIDRTLNSISFGTTGGIDYIIKINNSVACPLVQVGMSASFNCTNLKNRDTITIVHDPVSTVRVKMADSALSLGQQVASYYTGPTGDTYQDGMSSQQDIQVASGAHPFNIVIYYTSSDLFVVYRNNAQLCPFNGSTSSTYTCANVVAVDVINVYAAHCPNPALHLQNAQISSTSNRHRICLK